MMRPCRRLAVAAVLAWHFAFPGAALAAPAVSPSSILATLARACAVDPGDPASVRRAFPDGRLLESRIDRFRGGAVGSRHRVLMPGGGEWMLRRVFPGGRLRRVTLEWSAPGKAEGARPAFSVNADANCAVTEAREIQYDAAGHAAQLRILGPDLARVVATEALNPPVPPAPADAVPDGGGAMVLVAHVDTGVNYTLPLFKGRLVRDAAGRFVGYDYWDMDDRPFDVDTSRSPFFPLHHGTAVASIILREAPGARLIPYRYPRPDMRRFKDLIADADAHGAVIVNLAMGSNRADQWRDFAAAARARPHMLFIVSAGNDGRDLGRAPVYPAALGLDNMLTVTSSDAFGRLARGSNWSRRLVDVMVPGEQVPVIDHRGADGKASGSSFAVPRVTALAARLKARHPDWTARQLKDAIVKRAKRGFGDGPPVKHGWIPDPTDDFEG